MKQDPLDVIKDISEKELLEERPEPKWRKHVIILGAIILSVLVFSLSFSGFLSSIVQSKTIDNNMIQFKNATIVFENNVLQLLQEEFVTNEHREIKACLFGNKDGTIYNVNNIEFPKVLRASVSHVAAVPCSIDTLIDLHSHPINRCLASGHDVVVHSQRQKTNLELRMMIMCSSTRFALI